MITDVGNVQCSKQMFNVQCLKFKAQCSKFKAQCSKFNVQCSKLNVQCSKFKAQSSKFKVQCSMFNVQSLQLFRQYEPSFVFLIEFTLKIGIFRHEFHI